MLSQSSQTSKLTKLIIFNPIIGGFGLLLIVLSVAQAFSQPSAIISHFGNECYRHVVEKIAVRKKAHAGYAISDGYAAELHSRCE
jgi:hypothetical protein